MNGEQFGEFYVDIKGWHRKTCGCQGHIDPGF